MRDSKCVALALCLLLGLSGCAGDLENPERFFDGGPGAACNLAIDVEVDLLASATCTGPGCHAAESPNAAPDLASPGLAARLIDVAVGGCEDRVLVDLGDPQSSYLLESLRPDPGCGGQMPVGGSLSEEEIACVEQWIEGL
jgi:hypothetical protein